MTRRTQRSNGRCARTGLATLALLLAGPVAAQDGTRIGIGVDASRGDYGGTLDTDIVSVPVSLQLRKGRWQFDASVPWLRVSGDRNVVPSLGALPGLGTLVGGAAPGTGTERVTTSGPGDVQLSARRALETGGPLGIALGARAKIATTGAERGLGTGANDYGVTADVYRKVGGTLLFAGIGHDWLGDSPRITARTQQRANVGVSHDLGRGQLGLRYEARSALAEQLQGRREATAFYNVPTTGDGQVRIHAGRGFSEGSPEWLLGIGYSMALD